MLTTVNSNLPEPEYDQLVGRDEEEKALKRLLSAPSRFFIISINGMGGIGKTSLALETCYYYHKEYLRLPEEERYDYIVWTSAKLEDMTPSGRVRRQVTQATLRSILSMIAHVMNIREALTASEDRQYELILEALSRNRVLLVIDSFEQITNPASVVNFLHELPVPSKALLTSRPQQTVEAAKLMQIQGLKEEEGLRLIKQLCEARKLTDLNRSQQRELFQSTSGIPLVIMWALGQILDLKKPYSSIISHLEQGEIDLSEFCVADSFTAIKNRKAEEMILALLPLPTPVSRQMIGEIVNLSKEIRVRDEELNLLLALQLISKGKEDKFKISPLARTYLVDLNGQTKLNSLKERWAQYYYDFVEALIGKHGRVDAYSRELSRIRNEMDNISEILGSIADIKPSLYCQLLETLRYVLYMAGDWVTRDQFMQKGIEAANKTKDPCRTLLFASDLGWVATYRGRYERALQFFQSAQPALNLCSEAYYKAKFYLDQARLYELNAYERVDLTEAEGLYMTAKEEAEKATEVPGIYSTCLYYLGLFYYSVGNKGEAKNWFEKGLEVANSYQGTREADRHRSGLALLLTDNGKYDEARKLLERIIVNAEAYGDSVRVADYKFALARAEYKVGNRNGSLALLSEAESIYREIGRTKDVTTIVQFRKEFSLTR